MKENRGGGMLTREPGTRIRARHDIGSPLATAVPRDMIGTVLETRGFRHVVVRFANGRTLEVTAAMIRRLPSTVRPRHET
jgi:hypothetical protein